MKIDSKRYLTTFFRRRPEAVITQRIHNASCEQCFPGSGLNDLEETHREITFLKLALSRWDEVFRKHPHRFTMPIDVMEVENDRFLTPDGVDLLDWLKGNVKGSCECVFLAIRITVGSVRRPHPMGVYRHASFHFSRDRDAALFKLVFDPREKTS